jgi:E1-E2 ATPase
VEVRPGDTVIGATVNAGGRLSVRATRVGADTQLAQMARLVEDAQNGKAEVQRLAAAVSHPDTERHRSHCRLRILLTASGQRADRTRPTHA